MIIFFDSVMCMVQCREKEAILDKCDIKLACHLLYSDDSDLFLFEVVGGFYVDKALPMGYSIS